MIIIESYWINNKQTSIQYFKILNEINILFFQFSFYTLFLCLNVEAFTSFMHRHALIDSKHDTCKEMVQRLEKFSLHVASSTRFLAFAKIAFLSRKIERFKFSFQNLFIDWLHILKTNFLLSILFKFFCNWKNIREKDNIEIIKLNNK